MQDDIGMAKSAQITRRLERKIRCGVIGRGHCACCRDSVLDPDHAGLHVTF